MIAFSVLVFLPACGRRAQYGTSRPLTAYTVGWSDVAPPGAGVRFRIPGAARMTRGSGQEEDGARRRTTTVVTDARLGYFAVFVAEWEGGIVGDPLPAMAQLSEGIFRETELRRERSRRLSIDGFYAREDLGTDGRGSFVALREFVGGDRVVLAIAIVRRSPDMLRVAETFMSSITLDDANALFPTNGRRHTDGSWLPVYVPEAEFAITMPSAPSLREQEIPIAGSPRLVRSFESRDAWGRYRVHVISFEDQVPDAAFREVVRQLQLVTEVRSVEASGFPGRVYTSDVGDTRTMARVYQTMGRIYVVEAMGSHAAIRGRDVQRTLLSYFDSFRIL
jgi:hypothetical protein